MLGDLALVERDLPKAEALAAALRAAAPGLNVRVTGNVADGCAGAEGLINCTPVGMYPNMNDTPFAENWLREGQVVFDTVYNPENTLLIKQARDRGCITVSGIEMFIRQAAAQFERFTGVAADLAELRATLRSSISAINLAKS